MSDATQTYYDAYIEERDYAGKLVKWLWATEETIDMIGEALESAPSLPLGNCSPEQLRRWDDAIITVLKAVGMAQLASASRVSCRTIGENAPQADDSAGT